MIQGLIKNEKNKQIKQNGMEIRLSFCEKNEKVAKHQFHSYRIAERIHRKQIQAKYCMANEEGQVP